jgi:Ca2+-binding EF-hand superfamily protein
VVLSVDFNSNLTINLKIKGGNMSSAISGTSSMSDLYSSQTKNTIFNVTAFNKIDTKGTGSISKSDFESAMPTGVTTEQTDHLFSQIDSNGDGNITQAEVAKYSADAPLSLDERFANIDSNGDGNISKAELENAKPDGVTTEQADNLFSKLDTDGDSNISKSEYLTFLQATTNYAQLLQYNQGEAANSTQLNVSA